MAIDNVLEAFGSHIVGSGGGGGSGTGGHTIVDQDGNDMASEDDLQFADAFVSDDSTNGRTVIENIKECLSTDIANMGDGLFHTTDEEDAPIGDIEEDVVSVTASGDTYGTLIGKLYAEIDVTKVTDDAFITLGTGIYRMVMKGALQFTYLVTTSSTSIVQTIDADATLYSNANGSITNYTNSNVGDGTVITLHYGSSKAIVNLLTDAGNCMLDSNTSVKQAITRTELNIAPIESSTASQSYAIGDQFILNGLLYKATAAINQGGTIVPNGNCTLSDSVTEQLIPKSGTIECRAVFGTNNSNGTYASSMIPLINADKKTINITSCQAVGTSTELTVLVGRKSAIGFTITHNTSAVSGKTVNVTFTYS